MIEVHGKKVVIIGGRCFAVRRDVSLTDRVANASQGRSNYSQSMRIPDPRMRNTRSIRGSRNG
jgi:hypothetical protein